MATASSNRVRLRAIKQSAFGVTPTTGTSTDLRFTGESLAFAINSETSKEIRSDRQVADLIQTGAEASGDIQFELSYGTFDELFAGALGSAWQGAESPVLRNGTTLGFWSIEQGFTDINQFILYKDMAPNSLSLEFAVEAIATGSIGFMGTTATRSGASMVPAAAQQNTNEVMNTVAGFADLMIDDNAYPCGISKISLTTNAGLRAQKGLGMLGACSLNAGTFSVTGEIVAYFQDGTFFDKYVGNQPVSLSWNMSDSAGNTYQFRLPRVKFSDAKVNAGGLDQDVELTLPFQATLDPSSGCTIQITRIAGA